MKDKLMKLLQAKEEQRQALVAKSEKSEDVNELRSIHADIEKLNGEISELRGMIADIEKSGGANEEIDERTKAVNSAEGQKQEQRFYQPGQGFKVVSDAPVEDRDKKAREESEKRGKALKENRSVTIATTGIILPQHQATDIRPTFNEVSGLLDRVFIKPLPGGESFKQPYIKGYGISDYTSEGGDYATAEPTYGYAEINKTKITAYAEDTEELQKLPAADYDAEVVKGIRIAARKKITREILVGDGSTGHLVGIFSDKATAIDANTDLELAEINNNTLDEIIFSYGGDEDVEDAAVLILSKVDLKKFSQLRTADGKKFHDIVTNGNVGTIDGIPFIINSACKPLSAAGTAAGEYCMAYGPLSNYMLCVFSDMDVQRSTDYKFKQGMIAHKGSIFLGGNVVSKNGFIRIKKAAAA